MLIKRSLDVVVASILLCLISPLLLPFIWLIRRDGGSAIFVQPRVGQGGIPFNMYKFRSMIIHDQTLGSHFTKPNDSRITPVGKWIRKYSIDELPQLINVLKGDMSLIGPRPHVPTQRAQYTDEQWELRHRVRPGITGLAQVQLRSQGTRAEHFSLDKYYIKNMSLSLEAKILWLTFFRVFSGHNSN